MEWNWRNERKITRITDNPELSTALKIAKLQTMALKCYPSSPTQKMVREAYLSLQGPN